jgi:hypothetical protein
VRSQSWKRRKEDIKKMGKFRDNGFVKFVTEIATVFYAVLFPSFCNGTSLKICDQMSTQLARFREVIYWQ